MFKLWKENQKLKEQLKQKALENTSLIKKNEQLKFRLNKIDSEIQKFDCLNGNPFSLINKIKKEADYLTYKQNQPLNKQTNNN